MKDTPMVSGWDEMVPSKSLQPQKGCNKHYQREVICRRHGAKRAKLASHGADQSKLEHKAVGNK